MHKPLFVVQAIGPEGGSRTKSGVQTVRAFLLHEAARTSLTVEGFLLEGIPHVRIFASQSGHRQILLEEPMDQLFMIG
jgi:hypothetical protein